MPLRVFPLRSAQTEFFATLDTCYGVMTDFHAVLNLLLNTQCVRSRAFMRTWRHNSCRCVVSPFKRMFVLGAMLVVLNPQPTISRDDSTPPCLHQNVLTYQSVHHIDTPDAVGSRSGELAKISPALSRHYDESSFTGIEFPFAGTVVVRPTTQVDCGVSGGTHELDRSQTR
jgi:hypothetical protein